MLLRLVTSLAVLVIFGASALIAQEVEQRAYAARAYIARDVCNVAANFANASDGGEIAREAGQFRVQKGRGSVTVYEGVGGLDEVPGFTYKDYNDCLERVISALERLNSSQDAAGSAVAFDAGYELGTVLNEGTCMRSAAKAGFYVGNPEYPGVPPRQQESLEKLATAASKSIARQVKKLSGNDISLELERKVKFHRFYADQPFPYFAPEDIQEVMEFVHDAISSKYSDYLDLGFVVGRMERASEFIVMLSSMVEFLRNLADDRFKRAVNEYVPQSLACLRETYVIDQSRLQRRVDDLNLAGRISIPSVESALEAGRSASFTEKGIGIPPFARSTHVFDELVTARIRQSLRAAPQGK